MANPKEEEIIKLVYQARIQSDAFIVVGLLLLDYVHASAACEREILTATSAECRPEFVAEWIGRRRVAHRFSEHF